MEAIIKSVNNVKLNHLDELESIVDRHPVISYALAVVGVPMAMIATVGIIGSAVVLPILWLAAL